MKLIIVGLDNSGKTTIINWIKPKKESLSEITPTVGYTTEVFSKEGIQFTLFDMGGSSKYRSLWEDYCKEADGIIFVIDASDQLRLSVVREELLVILELPSIKAKCGPILFFANKMDIHTACSSQECVDFLNLSEIRDRSWHITFFFINQTNVMNSASCALKGEGIEEGFKWLMGELNKIKPKSK